MSRGHHSHSHGVGEMNVTSTGLPAGARLLHNVDDEVEADVVIFRATPVSQELRPNENDAIVVIDGSAKYDEWQNHRTAELMGLATSVFARVHVDELDTAEIRESPQIILGSRLWAELSIRPGEQLRARLVDDPPMAETVTLTPPVHFVESVRGRVAAQAKGLDTPLTAGRCVTIQARQGLSLPIRVTDISPELACIGPDTEVSWTEPNQRIMQTSPSLADVGGLSSVLEILRDSVALPLLKPQIFRSLGVAPPKGVLLYGPPGTGKTLISRSVANDLNVNTVLVTASELTGMSQGETGANLREMFSRAITSAPCLIVIDEFDAIAASRDQLASQDDIRSTSQLLGLMDGLQQVDGLVFIATTNRVDAVDPAFRRPGRFEYEIFVGPPDQAAREEILSVQSRSIPMPEGAIRRVAQATGGFVGADLMHLVRTACLHAAQRAGAIGGSNSILDLPELSAVAVTDVDFDSALKLVGPSAMRLNPTQLRDVAWSEIVGLDDLKEEMLAEARAVLDGTSQSSQGMLLVGPSGSGKSAIAESLALELKANLVRITGADVFTQWFGESEAGIRRLFDRATNLRPSILVIDHLDSVATNRGTEGGGDRAAGRAVTAMMSAIDAATSVGGVLVIGITDRPDLVDPGVIRPGRLGRHFRIEVPDAARREAMIVQLYDRDGVVAPDATVSEVSQLMSGWSAAEIVSRFSSIAPKVRN